MDNPRRVYGIAVPLIVMGWAVYGIVAIDWNALSHGEEAIIVALSALMMMVLFLASLIVAITSED